jgi:hypothetical protein
MKLSSSLIFLSVLASFAQFSANAFAEEVPSSVSGNASTEGTPKASAHGEGPTWEFSGNTSATWFHLFGESGSNATNNISAGTTADYFLIPALEVGLLGSFSDTFESGSPAYYQLVLAAGPTFNFLGEDPDHSFFIEARAGALLSNQYVSTSKCFYYLAGLGHRFELVHHVAWRPEVTFSGNLSSTNSSGVTYAASKALSVIPFQFSLSF